MALQIIATNTTNAGIGADLGTVDSIYVAGNYIVASTGAIGISGIGSGHQATIYGSVFGTFGLSLGDSSTLDSNQRVYIGDGATVGGTSAGVRVSGFGARVENHGEIQGTANGLIFSGTGATGSRLFNYGTIDGGDNGIARGAATNTETIEINNYGTITAEFEAFNANGASAIERIYNRGTITGDIDLGLGNDLYDGRGGVLNGTVMGGDGDDMFVLGAGADEVSGGNGIDLLDLRHSAAVRVALDGSFDNGGAAAGDFYFGIENIIGSTLGADVLVGDAQANKLLGLGGVDIIAGGIGNDTITGGYGSDKVSGGAGNDAFIFNLRGEAGDTISDFSNLAGNNDTLFIKAATFGGGLTAGFLAATKFQVRADNLAQDLDDRFILRTTDKTLWFDVNGSAAGGAILVADLQSTATMTASDIFLF